MKYVTGMIGDRVHTVTVDHGTVHADASIEYALMDLANKSDEALLAQCRLLFGDTMKVSEDAPQPVQFPFLADSPAKPGDVTQVVPEVMPGAGRIVNETQIQPPAMAGSAPMAASPQGVTTAEESQAAAVAKMKADDEAKGEAAHAARRSERR